ncbi:response regulator [Flavobacterium sp. MK4S-17]|uniref:response regulator n=1 Tax=Flavobacterium sp. MK4S-17 TaxID=2543737 RepID=UPI0013587447|nr:response regulator transcription factor [Flavobacterium sp. MK4S-17]
MDKATRVLAIDDHAVLLESYHTIFTSPALAISKLVYLQAGNCHEGYTMVMENKGNPFDIAVIDYSIPAWAEGGYYSGKDIAKLIRQHMPSCKIIMMTMHKECTIIEAVLQEVAPQGFINKSDCTTDELMECFSAVAAGKKFLSKTINNHIKQRDNGIKLDDTDIKIIRLLSKGIKSKALSEYLPLSNSMIEKRKQKIKHLLKVKGDEELVKAAKNDGYI